VLASYPDMPNVVKPNPEPTLLTAFDTFSPPVATTTPAGTAPAFAEWTRAGAPDDSLVMTGSNFSRYTGDNAGKDTQFLVFGQTDGSNSTLRECAIQRLDGMKAAITLDAALPAWSTYLVWPKNSDGYGYPAAVNRTDAWWLGPKKAIAGASISVFGQNLAHDNGTSTSYVYVKPSGSAGQWASVTAVNPYKVSFTVPSLANGTYEVWIHNGHGGHYGWSGPLTLTVYSGPGWTSRDFNVRSYGALGDGVTDDTTAIRNAITAAAGTPYSSLYFPAGTYMLSDYLTPRSNVRFRGDGKGSTFLKCRSNFNLTPYGIIFHNGNGNPTNIEIRDLTIDTNGYYPAVSTYPPIYLRFVTDLSLTNVAVKAKGTSALDFHGCTNTALTNCDMTGQGVFLGSGTQFFLTGCNFYGTNDCFTLILEWGRKELAMVNCTGQDENTTLDDGWGQGRFFTGNGAYGVSRNVYLGDNTSTDLTVRPGYTSNQNTGEQFMWEGNATKYRGTPTAATTSTVTFSTLATDYTGQEAIIVSGTGLGQHRPITGWDSASKTITVSPAWNLAPDSSSAVIIAWSACRYAIYHNYLDAKDYAATNSAHNASAGVEPYGGCSEYLVDSNTFHQVRTGTSTWALGQTNPTDIQPSYFHLYANNQYQNNRWAAQSVAAYYNSAGVDPGSAVLGSLYRHNTITSPVLEGFLATRNPWTGAGVTLDMTLYEHNSGDNLPVAVDLSAAPQSANYILYRNTLSRGTASYSGSQGIKFATTSQSPDLRENTWSGFEAAYAGTLPEAILEVPYRTVTASTTAYGSPVTDTVTLWNAGTSSLSWSATSDSAWLTLSAGSGVLTDEGSGTDITVTCNPSSLDVGSYTGTVTVTGAGQTKKITVLLTVGSPNVASSDLILWAKADAGVTKDGNNYVTQWNDQSSAGNHLTPTSSSCDPLYVSSGINSKPVIRFDGTNDNLRKLLSPTRTGAYTVFLVCAAPTAQAQQDQGGINNRVVSCPTTTDYEYLKGLCITTGSGSAFSPTLKTLSKTLDSNQYLYSLGLGAMHLSNGLLGNAFHFTGDIAEVLIYNRALTTQETADVTSYLTHKYNLP
jgi:hypothetical protein